MLLRPGGGTEERRAGSRASRRASLLTVILGLVLVMTAGIDGQP